MLVKRKTVTGLDIGTSNVRVVVGEFNVDGTINIIGVGTSPSGGLRKGVIVDLDKTVESIHAALEEAERMVGYKINEVYAGMVGSHVSLINNRGVVAVSREDKEITEEDTARVLQAAKVIAIPPDREIIDVLPREFVVDGYDGIKDPVGMLGVRLEVDALIITGAMTSLRNLIRCINRAGLQMDGLILNSLANAEVCLSRDEKELGVFLIDIGGGTTEIALFKEGGLQDLAVLPVGGDHITNDLAVGLKVTFQTAEDIKLSHGSALSKLTNPESFVEVKGISGKETKRISEEELNRYIEPRVEEMLQLALLEMEKTGYVQMPPAGIVLTGGVSLMRGVMEMAENIFGCSVRVATPQYLGVKSPIYSTAVGILQYVYRNNMASLQERSDSKVGLSGLWYRLRKWFSELWE